MLHRDLQAERLGLLHRRRLLIGEEGDHRDRLRLGSLAAVEQQNISLTEHLSLCRLRADHAAGGNGVGILILPVILQVQPKVVKYDLRAAPLQSRDVRHRLGLFAGADKDLDLAVAAHHVVGRRRLLNDLTLRVLAARAAAHLRNGEDALHPLVGLGLLNGHAEEVRHGELRLHRLLSEAAHDDVPQSEHDHRGQRDAAGQQKHFLRFFLVDRLVLLRLLPLRRDCLHGGDILRRLVGIGAAQILDAEIKVYVRVLAELLQVSKHGVRRRIAAVDVRGHRLHADLFQRLGHVGVDLPRGERHAA